MHVAPEALLLVVPLLIALWLGALISIIEHERTGARGLWLIATFVFPFAGPVAWFVFGRGASRRAVAAPRVPC